MSVEETPITCPVCGSDKAVLIQKNLNIPYYSDFFMTSVICRSCGLRSTDFRNLNSSDPVKWIYHATGIDDFETKVVRSASGIVEIPEIGIKVEPKMMPETWIKNLEGLLLHFRQKLLPLLGEDDESVVQKVQERIHLIDKLLRGSTAFTIIVEDPEGNSIIIPADESKLEKILL